MMEYQVPCFVFCRNLEVSEEIINLADEYANYIVRFGHWKDTGIRLYGEGVWSFTCMFFEMWRMCNPKENLCYNDYRPKMQVKEDGICLYGFKNSIQKIFNDIV